jgi:hypothetical protein
MPVLTISNLVDGPTGEKNIAVLKVWPVNNQEIRSSWPLCSTVNDVEGLISVPASVEAGSAAYRRACELLTRYGQPARQFRELSDPLALLAGGSNLLRASRALAASRSFLSLQPDLG